MLIKYDLAVLIERTKFLDDFETTIVNLYLWSWRYQQSRWYLPFIAFQELLNE